MEGELVVLAARIEDMKHLPTI